jgi:hypothetical protein
MRLLLDTHVLLWFQADDAKLSTDARDAILASVNERWLSPISLLEIALKNRPWNRSTSSRLRPCHCIIKTLLIESLLPRHWSRI